MDWSALLDRGVTAVIALYVIIRLEPRFAEMRDALRELITYLKSFTGGGN